MTQPLSNRIALAKLTLQNAEQRRAAKWEELADRLPHVPTTLLAREDSAVKTATEALRVLEQEQENLNETLRHQQIRASSRSRRC